MMARTPVGIRKRTSVSIPTIVPETRATRRLVASALATSSRSATAGIFADFDNCLTSLETLSASEGVIRGTLSMKNSDITLCLSNISSEAPAVGRSGEDCAHSLDKRSNHFVRNAVGLTRNRHGLNRHRRGVACFVKVLQFVQDSLATRTREGERGP